MKKVLTASLLIFCIVLIAIFHKDILQSVQQNDAIHGITSGVIGGGHADLEVADVGGTHYAYQTLTSEEQLVYNQMAACLTDFEKEVTLSTSTEAIADKAFQCLLSDHPEIFWCNAYELTIYQLSGIKSEYLFTPAYTMSKQEADRYQEQIDHYVAQCMSGITGITDEYEIAKYFYEYIIQNTDYNGNAPNNQNICSVFVTQESVCMGYSKAFQYLLAQAGISSSIVSGSSENEAHAWNLVCLNGIDCYVDVTWGDPEFNASGEIDENFIDYAFFGMTTDELLLTHSIDNIYELPLCQSQEMNYYKREGLYLEAFDKNMVQDIVEHMFVDHSYVSIRCKDTAIYQQLFHYLITDSNISRFINGNKIHYTEQENYHILTIFQP